MYQAFLSYLFRLSQFAVWIGGAMMLFAAVMVSADVLARKFVGISMGGSDEISGYLFAVSTALAFPYALLHRANVRIDVIYILLPRHVRAILDILGLGFLAIFAGVVTWRALLTVHVTWINDSHSITPLQTPLIVPQGLWLLGWCLFCLTLAVVFYGMISAFARGRLDDLQALGGALSMEEEIEDETQGVLPLRSVNPNTAPIKGE